MFARPIKKNDKKKHMGNKQKRDTAFSSKKTIQQGNYLNQIKINKIASIRTLPAFAYANHSSGSNSHHRSIGCSQTNSEIWRQEQLFESSAHETIDSIDKQLEDIVETIKRERNMIDMKIWKLKSKITDSNKTCPKGTMQSKVMVDVEIDTRDSLFRQIKDAQAQTDSDLEPNKSQVQVSIPNQQSKIIENELSEQQLKIIQNKKIIQQILQRIDNL